MCTVFIHAVPGVIVNVFMNIKKLTVTFYENKCFVIVAWLTLTVPNEFTCFVRPLLYEK